MQKFTPVFHNTLEYMTLFVVLCVCVCAHMKAVESEERIRPVCDGRSSRRGVGRSAALVGERGVLAAGHDRHLHGRPRGSFFQSDALLLHLQSNM